MRILAIADKESKSLWDYYQPGKLDGIDLIISCGDLDPRYLSFLCTFTHAPVLYVRGNHDDKYSKIPPDGCICIEDDIYVHDGVRILGIGGSMRYKAGDNQYSQREMDFKVWKLGLKILRHRGFDILVTHSPAFEVNDGKDLPHVGFKAFRTLLDRYSPRYFMHGHVHMSYGREYKRLSVYQKTLIINAYETYIFDYETEYEDKFEKALESTIKNEEEKKIKQQRLKELEDVKKTEQEEAAKTIEEKEKAAEENTKTEE